MLENLIFDCILEKEAEKSWYSEDLYKTRDIKHTGSSEDVLISDREGNSADQSVDHVLHRSVDSQTKIILHIGHITMALNRLNIKCDIVRDFLGSL